MRAGGGEARTVGAQRLRSRRLVPPVVCVVTAAGLVPDRDHLAVGAAALAGGADMIQLRGPELDALALRPLAERLAERCHAAGRLLIVNNALDVACTAGADGVHLGQSDHPETARRRLGDTLLLGVSVATAGEAHAAAAAGADYVAVTVWSTATKPDAQPVGLAGLAEVVTASPLPTLAIGGITAGNCGDVLARGAAGIAVVSAVAGAADPVTATRELVAAARAATT